MPQPPDAVIKAITRLTGSLHSLADAPVPAPIRILNLVARSTDTAIVRAFIDLGIADALRDGALEVTELAERIDADPVGLQRFLRSAQSLGLVSRRAGRYRLTATGDHFREDHPMSFAPWARYHTSPVCLRAWESLADSVRTNSPAYASRDGKSIWEWFAEHPDEERDFTGSMRTIADIDGPSLARLYPFEDGQTVCDVGGGIGTLLSHVLAANPTLRGVLVDGPGPTADAPGFLAERGVADRVDVVEGDLFGPLSVQADVFLLKDVLHDWDDERCLTILRHVRDAMRPTDRVGLVEIIQDPVAAHRLVPMVDLEMLVLTDGGRQRTVEELDMLLRSSGLRRVAIRDGLAHSVVVAAPA